MQFAWDLRECCYIFSISLPSRKGNSKSEAHWTQAAEPLWREKRMKKCLAKRVAGSDGDNVMMGKDAPV